MASQSTRTYFRNFFVEKDLPFQQWEIETSTDVHILSSEDVIAILRALPANTLEARRILADLSVLDFRAQPILPYLRHLAEAYIRTNFPDTAYAAR